MDRFSNVVVNSPESLNGANFVDLHEQTASIDDLEQSQTIFFFVEIDKYLFNGVQVPFFFRRWTKPQHPNVVQVMDTSPFPLTRHACFRGVNMVSPQIQVLLQDVLPTPSANKPVAVWAQVLPKTNPSRARSVFRSSGLEKEKGRE